MMKFFCIVNLLKVDLRHRKAREGGREGGESVKVTVGQKDRPVIVVRIGDREPMRVKDVKQIIEEMNKEYGESHTLYFKVKF